MRTALFASAVMTLAVVLLALAARAIVMSSFADVEGDEAVANMERVGSALEARIQALPKTARDWAGWDDTYQFAADGSQAYVDANLAPEALANLGVSYMVFLDPNGSLIHASGVDAETSEALKAEPTLVDAILAADWLFDLPKLESSTSGVIQGPDGLLLAAAAPITDSSVTKPARGSLVVLASFDEAALADLALQTRLNLSFTTTDEAARLSRINGELGHETPASGASLVGLSDRKMTGFWPVSDPAGRTLAVIAVDMSRGVWGQGLQVARWLTGVIGIFGLLAVASVFGIVDRRDLAMSRSMLEHAVADRTRELVTSEARFRDLVDHMAQGLLALDADGKITFANREAERLFGAEAGLLVGRKAADLFLEDDLERHLTGEDARISSVDASVDRYGAPIPVQIVATGTGEGAAGQWLVRDVTMQRRYEQQLVHLASHDHMTGLANRRQFEQELEREIARAVRVGGGGGGVLWLDIDDFKEVNDSLGHRAGDELLVGIAGFLLGGTRASGIVARIGGDEFAILVPEASLQEIEATAQRLLADMSQQRFEISGHRLAVTASIGAVVYPDHGASVEELLSRADIAMYSAKERGAGGYSLWSATGLGDESNRTRLEWSERIRHAIENDSVVVFAQPIARSETGDIASHELLMRLPGDEPGSLIMPADFLPAAERLGLIRDLDRWMVMNAIKLVAERPELGVVHVNLSGRAFADAGLLDVIEAEFTRTGADPSHVGFEITETAAIADIQCARELIGGLRRLGCGLSLDDFGSGFSSFYYLRNLPIDCLKIDGSFVRQLTTSEADRHLVRAMVELAKALGLDTVAEYVEDEATLAIVRDMGVTFAQGYHVGRPGPLATAVEGERR